MEHFDEGSTFFVQFFFHQTKTTIFEHDPNKNRIINNRSQEKKSEKFSIPRQIRVDDIQYLTIMV